MTPEQIQKILRKSEPITLRRVLPKEFIESYIRQYLQQMRVMMQSFQAILTFPTGSRTLPKLVMHKMHEQFQGDLKASGNKIQEETGKLMQAVSAKKIVQSHLMLNILSETAFPFCLLNTINYVPIERHKFDDKTYVPCYVVLWAQQATKDSPISVWAQLSPCNPQEHKRLLPHEMRSETQTVRYPTGEVNFYAYQTAIHVALYDIPTDADAIMAGKSLRQMMEELKALRATLVRQKNQKGNFLHFLWTAHDADRPDYVPIEESTHNKGWR